MVAKKSVTAVLLLLAAACVMECLGSDTKGHVDLAISNDGSDSKKEDSERVKVEPSLEDVDVKKESNPEGDFVPEVGDEVVVKTPEDKKVVQESGKNHVDLAIINDGSDSKKEDSERVKVGPSLEDEDAKKESNPEGDFVPEVGDEEKPKSKSHLKGVVIKTEIAERLKENAASLREQARELIDDALRLEGKSDMEVVNGGKKPSVVDVIKEVGGEVTKKVEGIVKHEKTDDETKLSGDKVKPRSEERVVEKKSEIDGDDGSVEVSNPESGKEDALVKKPDVESKDGESDGKKKEADDSKVEGGLEDNSDHSEMSCPINDGIPLGKRDDWQDCMNGCKGYPGMVKSTPYYGESDSKEPVKIVKWMSSGNGKSLYRSAIVNIDSIPSIQPLLEKAQADFCEERASEKDGGGCLVVMKRYQVPLPDGDDFDESSGLMIGTDDYCQALVKLRLEPEMGSDLATRTVDGSLFNEGRHYVMPSLGYYVTLDKVEDDPALFFSQLWPVYINDNLETYVSKKTKAYSDTKMSAFLNNVAYEGCLSLAHAHELGWIHRDIKPENFFVDGAGRAILADFDLSTNLAAMGTKDKSLEAVRAEQACELVGTEGYLAPELGNSCAQIINEKTVAGNKNILFARDMWAFGKTLLVLSYESSMNSAAQRYGGQEPWVTVARGMLESDVSTRMTAAKCTAVMRAWMKKVDQAMEKSKLVTDVLESKKTVDGDVLESKRLDREESEK